MPLGSQIGPGTGNGAASAAADQPSVNTTKLDNLVPTFSNVMADYREYRKRCEIYRKKMDIGNRGREVVFNLVTLMTGKS